MSQSNESTSRPYDRRAGESSKAYAAFVRYRDLGGGRSIEKVATGWPKSGSLLRRWSSRYEWVARAAAFDDDRDRAERAARARVAEQEAEKWQRRRLEAAGANWDRAQRLATKAEEMLKFPLSEQTITATDTDGRPLSVTLEPTRWNLATACAAFKLAAELQSAAIADGLGGQDDGFDPTTATAEECREYLERRGVKSLPAPAPSR